MNFFLHLSFSFLESKRVDYCNYSSFLCRQLPTSLEELLEYQWDQGAQFLMQQASQYDGKTCVQKRVSISEGFCHVCLYVEPNYIETFKYQFSKMGKRVSVK